MSDSEAKICLKLLVDSKANKVLFAEAGKDSVDFIFHILSLPLGTIVKLLSQEKMVGCLGDLYKSVEFLDTQYFQSDLNKDLVLNPKSTVSVPLLSLHLAPFSVTPGRYYSCCNSLCNSTITDYQGMRCPNCSFGTMSFEMKYVKPAGSMASFKQSSSGNEGYVKGLVTYMVMDNLEVKPMSTISGITLMNKFHVKDVSSLEEKEVQISLTEGLEILKASLETKDVLTTVFLQRTNTAS